MLVKSLISCLANILKAVRVTVKSDQFSGHIHIPHFAIGTSIPFMMDLVTLFNSMGQMTFRIAALGKESGLIDYFF